MIRFICYDWSLPPGGLREGLQIRNDITPKELVLCSRVSEMLASKMQATDSSERSEVESENIVKNNEKQSEDRKEVEREVDEAETVRFFQPPVSKTTGKALQIDHKTNIDLDSNSYDSEDRFSFDQPQKLNLQSPTQSENYNNETNGNSYQINQNISELHLGSDSSETSSSIGKNYQ